MLFMAFFWEVFTFGVLLYTMFEADDELESMGGGFKRSFVVREALIYIYGGALFYKVWNVL